MMRPFMTAALLLCAAPALAAEPKTPAFAPQLVAYSCNRGVTLEAAYVNGDSDKESAVVLHADGRLIALPIAQSASGARYSWSVATKPSGYTWWTKGAGATLSFAPEGGKEETVLVCEEYRG